MLGPDDPGSGGTSNQLVRRFLLRQIPVYIDGALNIVDVRDVAAGHLLADEKGKVGERYILGGRNFTLDRLFADLSRISGVPPPPSCGCPAPSRSPASSWRRTPPLPIPTSVDEVRSGMEWWTYRSDKAQRELGFRAAPPRGDARGDGAVADGQARRSGGADAALRAAPRRRGPRAADLREAARPVSSEAGSAPRPVVLYRCRTPTNVLCPCGAVERRLRKLGIEHETQRVPYRRSDRPEIVELTGQNRVPVLVDGQEVIHDSKRILQYLDHEYGDGAQHSP